jgi:hypothetical protein
MITSPAMRFRLLEELHPVLLHPSEMLLRPHLGSVHWCDP